MHFRKMMLFSALLLSMSSFGHAAPADAAPSVRFPSTSDIVWLVPAYANPCCLDGPAMWSALIAAGQVAPDSTAVIVNPHNGPGASPIDPNYIAANGQGPLVQLHSTGTVLLGYISTAYGNRDLAIVRQEMSRFFDPAYWRHTQVRIGGFFFDEMSNDLGRVGYYQSLRDHAMTLHTEVLLVGNPGIFSYGNPSQQTDYTPSDYGAVFDVLVLHEAGDSAVNHGYQRPDWQNDPGVAGVGFIAYGALSGMRARVALSRMLSRGAVHVYVTDDVLPNPYDSLSGYWDRQRVWLGDLLFADHFD